MLDRGIQLQSSRVESGSLRRERGVHEVRCVWHFGKFWRDMRSTATGG